MSEKYKIHNQDALYFITSTIVGWIDLFTKPVYKHIIMESLQYCRANKGLAIHAYVLMESHLHAIVSKKEGVNEEQTLQEVIRDFKKFTSKQLFEASMLITESRREWITNYFAKEAKKTKRRKEFKVWKDGFHPIELDTNDKIEQRMAYIHTNPVESEIVTVPEHYKYSSAIDYAGGKGVIEIDKLY